MDKNVYTEFWNGQLIEIHSPNQEIFFTQLIQHEPELLIQRPVNQKNIPMIIEDGMSVTIYFHDDVRGLCTFDSSIHLLQNRKPFINKPPVNAIKEAQRRHFFRIQVAVETHLLLPSVENLDQVEDLVAFTYDISGGGASFLFPRKLVEEGNIVKGILHLNFNTNQKKVAFSGRIVHVIKQQNKIYKTSLQFVEMNESIRKDIIQFCMFKQIELRNKLKGDR